MSGRPIRISRIIHDTGALRRLLSQSRAVQDLDARLRGFLPMPLREHCSLAAIDQDNATLLASSPAWSSRLRYMTPAILEFLRGPCGQEQLRSLRIRIAIPGNKPVGGKLPAPGQRLSKQAAEHLRNAARHCSDAEVGRILLRIATHGQK